MNPFRLCACVTVLVVSVLYGANICVAQVVTAGFDGCGKPFSFILRQDFTDVPVLDFCSQSDKDKKTDLKTALGTRISYVYDNIHQSSGASVDGLAALNIHIPAAYAPAYISEVSFGPYAQGSGTHTFATPSSDASTTDTVTAGAYVQFYLDLPHNLPFLIRLRGGELTDNTGVNDGAAVFELIPAFEIIDLPGNYSFLDRGKYFIFGSPFALLGQDESPVLLFTPELEAQYDSYQKGPTTYSLFTTHPESMRLGPLVALKLADVGYFFGSTPSVIDTINKFALSVTYHADWDTLSNQQYFSFQPAIIYNLTKDGNYAVTTSYSIGDSEFTGNRTRQLKVAFSTKF